MKEDKKKKKDKKKDDRKKKEKRSDRSKHKRHRKESSTSSSGSETLLETLEREKRCIAAARRLLAEFPPLKQGFREVCWQLDHGEAIDISGAEDPRQKELLQEVLDNLNLKSFGKGRYLRRPSSSTVLSVLGYVFEEEIRPVSVTPPAGRTGSAPSMPGAQEEAGAQLPTSSPPGEFDNEVVEVQEAPSIGPQLGPFLAPSVPTQGGSGFDDDDCGRQKDPEEEAGGEVQLPVEESEAMEEGPAKRRRVLGPAAPPPEVLAAAQEVAETLRQLQEEEEDLEEDMIGPPPPELVEGMEGVADDERSAEVVRVLKVLADDKTPEPDAYQVLGMPAGSSAGEVKKKYWRLSLMIHPDKCSHPQANVAFQAVSQAARVLQDMGLRSAHDEKLEDRKLKKLAEQMAAQQERERQWRVLRGEEPAGPSPPGPPQRESWMTELPPERRPQAQMSQVSVTAFSQSGKTSRGDTSDWTLTPQQKAQHALEQLKQKAEALTYADPFQDPSGAKDKSQTVEGSSSAGVDPVGARRPKSLLDLHKEEQNKAKKEKKKNKAGEKGEGKEEWEGVHPWRPFDREKDLEIARPAKSPAELLQGMGGLSKRFTSGRG